MSSFRLKYRNIGTFLAMDPNSGDRVENPQRGKNMELLIFLGVFVAWIILQVWVLPRFGVQT